MNRLDVITETLLERFYAELQCCSEDQVKAAIDTLCSRLGNVDPNTLVYQEGSNTTTM